MKILKNKNAVITGGSNGIGLAIAQKMVQNGSTVTQTHMATTVQKIRAFRPFYGKS